MKYLNLLSSYFWTWLLIVPLAPALAQIKGHETMPEIRDELVVTAQFKPESAKESIVAIQVFDQKEIEAKGATNLRELLAQEPNLAMIQHSVFGSSLIINGISQENVQILIDGMPAIGRLNGVLDLEQFNLANFQRVELIRGPASVYYGTDSLGGIVNLISKTSSTAGLSANVSSQYRNVGDWQHGTGVSFSRGSHSFQLTYGQRDFEGQSQGPARRQDWAQRDQDSLHFKWQARVGSMSLSYLSSFFDESLWDLGEPQEGRTIDFRYQTQRTRQQINLAGHLRPNLYAEFNLGYSDFERNRNASPYFVDSDHRGDPLPRDPAFDNQFDLLKFRGMVSWENFLSQPSLAAQLGIDVSREKASGGRLADDRQDSNDQAIFAGLRWHHKSGLSLQPMVRFINNSLYDAPITPSLHIKYSPNDRLDWRASYTRGFRGPSLKQLFLDFNVTAGPFRYHIGGNPDLDAERGHHLTSHLQFHLPDHQPWHPSFEASGFYNDVRDLITLSAITPVSQQPGLLQRRYINIERHRGHGGTLGLRTDYHHTQLSLSLSHSRTGNHFASDPGASDFSGRWDWHCRLTHHLKQQRMIFQLLYKHIGEQPGFVEVAGSRGQPATIRPVHIDSYELIDLTWSWRLRQSWRLYAGGMNLLDVRQQNVLESASQQAHAQNQIDWGRYFQVGFNYHWSPH